MKKFYTLALAAAVGCTAWAAQLTPYTTTSVTGRQAQSFTMGERTELQLSTLPAKAPAKAEGEITWKLLGQGTYMTSIVGDYYLRNPQPEEVTIYEDAANPGYYKVEGLWHQMGTNLSMIVDATDPEYVIVPYQNCGFLDDVDGVTYIASQTYLFQQDGYSKDVVIAQVPYLVPVLKDGAINFPANSLLLRWPEAPADSEYETDPDSYYGAGEDASAGYLILPGGTLPEPVDPWETLDAQAQWLDNVFYSTFTGKNNEDYATVEVKRSTTDPNLLLIKNAFATSYTAILGSPEGSPDMEFDITDADNVTVALQTTGISGRTDGEYYYFNEGWYSNQFGQPMDATLAATLTYDATTDQTTIIFPEGSFTLYASGINKYYYGGQAASILVIHGAAGVKSVAADNADAPVVYYNLQGVEVANPEAGLYIRRQGTTATKVMIK